jgi:carbon monoxide dehydrogenase subunit G
MKLTNQFDVPMPPAETWAMLMDIERIATCVPGAELVEVVDKTTYKGKVSVKLGPVALAFLGTARFVDIDEAAHTATVKAQGTDQKGRGGANAAVKLCLVPLAEGTRVTVDTDVNLSGSVAQYGRGSGIIESLAAEITSQFAANLRRQIEQQKQIEQPAVSAPPQLPASPPPIAPAAPIGGLSLAYRVLRRRLLGLLGRSG